MSTPDRGTDGGKQWRTDLPETWEGCDSVPPLASGLTQDPDVEKRAEVTVFRLPDSGTRWIRADHEKVLYPTDYR